jgi:hypothetical protein
MTNLFPEILNKEMVGDWKWPSTNEFGIPDLLPSLQPRALELPLNRWGTIARKTRVEGSTYHFYEDDYKFTGLWKDPTPIVNSGCRAICAPNFSTNGDMPKAVVLAYLYMSKWICRWAQSYGIEIWADLALNEEWYDLALLGIPKGKWKAYSTFVYTRDYKFKELEDQYELACKHAGTEEGVMFLVYGGEHDTQSKCQARGWLWTPAHQQAYLRNIGGTKQRQPKTMKALEKQVKIELPKLATLEDWC